MNNLCRDRQLCQMRPEGGCLETWYRGSDATVQTSVWWERVHQGESAVQRRGVFPIITPPSIIAQHVTCGELVLILLTLAGCCYRSPAQPQQPVQLLSSLQIPPCSELGLWGRAPPDYGPTLCSARQKTGENLVKERGQSLQGRQSWIQQKSSIWFAWQTWLSVCR